MHNYAVACFVYRGGLQFYNLRFQLELAPAQEEKDVVSQPTIGFGISEVVESNSEHLNVGQIVSRHGITWENYTVHKDPQSLTIMPNKFVSLDFTAHNMLKHVGHIKSGQTVFVSSAASILPYWTPFFWAFALSVPLHAIKTSIHASLYSLLENDFIDIVGYTVGATVVLVLE
ncbi:hypothetical protein DFQ26_009406, partial [Actinomortierella ambigua]